MKYTWIKRYSWFVLAYTIAVIVWGAYVRATGSGAGCGSHWPLCNGVVVPKSPQIETIIEFIHRFTSGAILVFVGLLFLFIWKTQKDKVIRWGAGFSVLFTLTEALIGAGLVLFELVAGNVSTIRIISTMAHLVNTFLLLASLSMIAWWLNMGVPGKITFNKQKISDLIGLLTVLLLGASGAVTALGDTLFPPSSLREGLTQDFTETANILIRLRIIHPIIAVMAFLIVIWIGWRIVQRTKGSASTKLFCGLITAFLIQLGLGSLNIYLLAPVGIQLVHLFVSTIVWVLFVLLITIDLGKAGFSDCIIN
jgi:heme A synthase